MARKNAIVETGKRSKDWPEFMCRLAEVLGRLEEDQYLVINIKQTNKYVQFAGQGSYGLRAETTSNYYLEKGEKLDRKQVVALKSMGWHTPTGKPGQATPKKDPDGSPNFFAEFESPIQGETVASMAVETLAGVLGVTHPGMLEYEAFDSSGAALEFRQLGLKVSVRKTNETEIPTNAAGALLKTLRDETGFAELELDGDGDIGIRYGSMIAYARVFDSPPVAHFFSPLVREVDASPELFERLNELNRGSREVRYFVVDGTIFAAADVRIDPFVEANVAQAFRHFCRVADDVDNLLQSEFGGKTMFVEWVPSTARH